jgi:tetratricopeptide (TPR) repeat protein
MLNDLQLTEFIYEQPAHGDVEYTFKHVLTQDVAYNSVLSERRRQLHDRIGASIEVLYTQSIDDHFNQLAHHYGRGANTRKAVEYLWRAGQPAVRRSAFREGLASLTHGLELLQKLPDDSQRVMDELRLQNTLVVCWTPMRAVSSPELRTALERALQLSQRLGDSGRLLWALAALCNSYVQSSELQSARELSRRAVSIAEDAGNPRMIAIAHMHAMGQVLTAQGEFEAAREHLEKGLAAGWHELPFGFRAFLLSFLAEDLWLLGYPEQALNQAREVMTLAKNESDLWMRSISQLFALSRVYRWRRDEQVLEDANRLLADATEHGLSISNVWARLMVGYALGERGRAVEGLAEIERALIEGIALKLAKLTSFELTRAEAYGKVGRVADALKVVANALRKSDETGERRHRAELHRLHGELLLMQDAAGGAEAERSFRTAIDVAREQRAKSWELRATTSLARLLARTDHREEALTMLAAHCATFQFGQWFPADARPQD